MLAHIVRNEWRLLLADRTIWVLAALFAAVIGYGLYNGASWEHFQRSTIARAEADQVQRLKKLRNHLAAIEEGRLQPAGHMDPRSASAVGSITGAKYVAMPPAPLAAFSAGQSDLYPYYYKVTLKSRQAIVSNDEIENPTNLLAGRFDLAFVLVYLYPLLILALSYNLISAEKEQGTLALTLSQPVSIRTLAAGKVLLRSAVLLAMAAGFTLAGALLAGVNLFASGALPLLALWIAAVFLYGAFWFGVAVLVNAYGRGSAANALTLSGIWLLLVLIVPALVNLMAASLYPVPSRVEMIQATREAGQDSARRGSLVLARYFEDHPELAPADGKIDANDFMTRAYAVQEETDRLVQPVVEHFENQVRSQQAIVDRFRFLSPAILAQEALNEISGTGVSRYRHFLRAVDEYSAEWKAFFKPKIFGRVKVASAEIGQLPEFQFKDEDATTIAGRTVILLAGLAASVFLVFILTISMLRRYVLLASLAACLLFVAPAAEAQSLHATLTGLVLDATGAPLSKASVALIDKQRGQQRQIETNEAGQFRSAGLLAGSYDVLVKSPGFAHYSRESLDLAVGGSAHLEIQLQPATVQESVVVTAELSEIDRVRNSAARSTTFTSTDIAAIPTVSGNTSRNYSTQVLLVPGVAPGRAAHAPFAFNGLRAQSTTNIMVDGADFNNPNTGSLAGAGYNEQPVSQEILAGVEVQSNNFKSEYGRAAGGNINLVTQSGTNEWHGKFYEFFRNSALDARNAMLSARAPMKRNQFGLVLAGPIVKDRLFVVANGEWLLNRALGTSNPRATFTDEDRARAHPSVQRLLDLYPEPNVLGSNLYDLGDIRTRDTFRTFFLKGDYAATEKHMLSVRGTKAENLGNTSGRVFGQGQDVASFNRSYVTSLTSALNPSTVNEARVYYTNRLSNTVPFAPLLGDPAVNGIVGQLNIVGAERAGSMFRNYLNIHNYQASNDVSLTRGRQGLKFGGVVRRIQVNNTENGNTDGTLTFDSREAFLQGRPRTYTRVLGDTRLDQRSSEVGLYAQTDYRFRPNLNFNLGLRWELYTPGVDIYDRVAVNYPTDYNNFAPRLGFSWSPRNFDSLVVRGGWGMFYTPLPLRYLGNTRFLPPRLSTYTAVSPQFPNLLSGIVTLSSERTETSPDLQQPYAQQYNLTIDHRLPGTQAVVSVAYVGTRSLHLPVLAFPNGGERLSQAQRPDPSRGLVRLLTTSANGNYNSLQAAIQGRLTNRLSIRSAYTWSKALDELSTDGAVYISEANRTLDRGLADFHLTHNFNTAGTYSLPWNIQIGGIVTARSGRPFSILSGTDTPDGNRVNRINDVPGTLARVNEDRYALRILDRTGLIPLPGQVGTLGRNTETGDGFVDVSMSLQKAFVWNERWRAELRAEGFNLMNTVNYDAYIGSIADPRFGQAASALPARTIQLALRILF